MRKFTDGHTFFIGDTHFFHENIIEYEGRPFETVEEMNRQLIKNWNKVITGADRVFLLGDFSFGSKDMQQEIAEQLKGYKILITGNHDNYSLDHYKNIGFAEVYRYPIILDDFWMLSHSPLYVNKNMPYANLFAHVHSNPIYCDYSSQSMCVSVERQHMNYTPIRFDKVKELMGVSIPNVENEILS